MKVALLLTFIFLLFVGGIGVLLWFVIRKIDPSVGDKSESADLAIAQDFLPFEDIRDNMIVLPDFCYRAVIECSSINYDLKTEGEREQIELSFQQFINSLSFPISFFLQTKELDNSGRIQELKQNSERTLIEFPQMREYAERYISEMELLNTKIGNTRQKKRYIVVNYDEAGKLEKLSAGEKSVYAAMEILNYCNAIRSGLSAVGILSHTLSTNELIDLLYSCYNRENAGYAQSIAAGEAFTLFVDGTEDKFRDLPKVGALDLLLGESINKIRMSSLDTDSNGKAVLEQLEALRKKYAGYFTEEGIAF
ncbi:MAG: hypothetical protein IKC03_04410 [Oscillospiraceae bacterium]|nr:hypothetical protein [Oscillospiraceae bacterium]